MFQSTQNTDGGVRPDAKPEEPEMTRLERRDMAEPASVAAA